MALLSQGLVVLLSLVAALFMAIGVVLRQRATIDVLQKYGVSTAMIATLRSAAGVDGRDCGPSASIFSPGSRAGPGLLLVVQVVAGGIASVCGASLWAGGPLALLAHALRRGDHVDVTVRRFSAVAGRRWR